MKRKRKARNIDHPWKDTLEDLFPWMIRFCNAKLYHLIDWSKGYTFLDKELRQIMPRGDKKSRRYVDKLAQVTLKSGEIKNLFIHVEFQDEKEKTFSFRMFTYYYRLLDHFGPDIYSMAILGDSSKDWEPSPFKHQVLNCKIRFDFPVIKLSKYEEKWDRLERSRNPFALVVMAHLKAARMGNNLQEKVRWKRFFMRMALTRGHKAHEIRANLRYLEWIMRLPKALDRKLERELDIELGGELMALRTRWEREAEKRGKKVGREEGKLAMARILIQILHSRFGDIPGWVKEKVGQAETALLEAWAEKAMNSDSIGAVFVNHPQQTS